MMRLSTSLASVLVLCSSSNLSAAPDPDASPPMYQELQPKISPDGARVLFCRFQGGRYHLRLMDRDGSNVKALTKGDFDNYYAKWSPDGSQIAFASTRDGNDEIYVMQANGTSARRLTNDDRVDTRPEWSPDGQWIAFETEIDEHESDLYLVRPDGSEKRVLYEGIGDESAIAWSPDGSSIAFSSDRDGDREIYVMNLESGEWRQLTANTTRDFSPHWSPDGTRIVWYSRLPDDISWVGRYHGEDEIFIMNTDGSEKRRLTHSRDWDYYPSFSPDGRTIIFDSKRDGRRGVYTMTLDGSNVTKLTNIAMSPFVDIVFDQGAEEALAWLGSRDEEAGTYFHHHEMRDLGWKLIDHDRLDDARLVFELNASENPASKHAEEDLAHLALLEGDVQQAIRHLRRSLELMPEDEFTRDWLANLESQMDD